MYHNSSFAYCDFVSHNNVRNVLHPKVLHLYFHFKLMLSWFLLLQYLRWWSCSHHVWRNRWSEGVHFRDPKYIHINIWYWNRCEPKINHLTNQTSSWNTWWFAHLLLHYCNKYFLWDLAVSGQEGPVQDSPVFLFCLNLPL